MKIKFMGAAGTVTGSSYILTSGSGKSVVIDLGMFMGPDVENLNYDHYVYDCSLLSGAILTHAHLDHCGRLPLLLSGGFTGNINMTPATRELTELSLFDSAKIAKQDGKPILYDKKLAEKTVSRFKTINYGNPFEVGDFTVIFRDAGHILGSASLEITDKYPNSSIKKIIFSGDLGNTPEDLLHQTEYIDNSDAVVTESTYGDSLHPKSDSKDALKSEIQAIEISGGTLLIPAFSLDRTQELLHMLFHLKADQQIKPQTPVFLDSPMAQKATDIYLGYPGLFNSHLLSDFQSGSPFQFPGLKEVKGRGESESINVLTGPKVIISGSGMMNGGRIVGHAARYLPDRFSRLLIVGYQGKGTLGRELMLGSKLVVINGVNIPVNATVTTLLSMSSHADQGQLLTWLKHIQGTTKVFITHGEDLPRQLLSQKITSEIGIKDVNLPLLHQEFAF